MAPSSQPDRGRWSCAPAHRPPDARTRCRHAPRHDLTYACGSMRVHPLTAVALALVLLTCTLASEGFTEVRFAGGTWGFGGNRAAALVVFQAPGLTSDDVADFYTASAKAANRTTVTGESKVTMGGQTVRRMDSSTGDRTQTVVVWPSSTPDTVNIVLTNDLPDPKIED